MSGATVIRRRDLSKSKLMAYRQCRKRLWLEVHHPELRADSTATQNSFAIGYQVGDIAQRIYDPENRGVVIDAQVEGFEAAFARSQDVLQTRQPVFEAGFRAEGAMAFADVLLPVGRGRQPAWRMVEVKSSTSVKDYHRDDAAVQAFVARASGVPLRAIALAHIDNRWEYPGDGNYQGLLRENDLSEEALGRASEVRSWIADAQVVIARQVAPDIKPGPQCHSPYACGFLSFCQRDQASVDYPVSWLPGSFRAELKNYIEARGAADMRDVPDALLSARQHRVKAVSVSGQPYFDQAAAAAALDGLGWPAYFLDFETVQFAVPIWPGTRPYQQLPFQFSLHRLSRNGKLSHRDFLDLSGRNPSRAFAQALIDACGQSGPIFVYNAGFETGRIRELAERFPALAEALLAINERVVDLLPVARQHYYHPGQQGSWSIKAVLPTVCPTLRYDDLDGVQDGDMAMTVYREALLPETTQVRRLLIEKQLRDYCALDTYALVQLWSVFTGRPLRD